MIRGIHHVAVHVHDLDRMMAFYKEAFGFELVGDAFSWSDDEFIDRIVDVPGSAARGAMLRAGTCYMELFQFSAPRPDSERPLQPYDKGRGRAGRMVPGEVRARALPLTRRHISPPGLASVSLRFPSPRPRLPGRFRCRGNPHGVRPWRPFGGGRPGFGKEKRACGQGDHGVRS